MNVFTRDMFLVGGLWNVVGGCSSWWGPRGSSASPAFSRRPPAYYDGWLALLLTFGIGYLMVWRDMYGNKNIVILGIIGKLAFAAVFVYNMMAFGGQIPRLFLIPVIGDLVFVVLYWMFLNFAKRIGR